jgi:hypothetical protein
MYPNVGFTKCKVKRVVNLFEDTGSVRELNYNEGHGILGSLLLSFQKESI